ncbi:YfiR family protein [Rhodoferax saidenbachensis]|uniref:DUF4154 domain-containing protein n=1 Tax=Rhodoferax saidenbachensis TaxID=1484693 RepID=A0ABU1ZK59_9BURK|nr:YfiR family protein [Rhodoferax saidenbachensis]MDR7305763.1 hypothetical protein [Rhodoferax saidenbachensis]
MLDPTTNGLKSADCSTSRRSLLARAIASLALGHWDAGSAQTESLLAEYKVKAAYIYKFASYVQWPTTTWDAPETPMVIGLLGADLLADELTQMVTDRRVDNHPLHVRKLRRGDPLMGVHILFMGRGESSTAHAVLASARGKPVLTVTESEPDFAAGSIVNFVVLDNKIRFDVAPRQGELANLKISARLLTVARKVIGETS